MRYVVGLVAVAFLAASALARVKEGNFNLDPKDDLVYFSKFCFTNADSNSSNYNTGKIIVNYTVTYVSNASKKVYWALFYDDGDPDWEAVYHNTTGMSCRDTLDSSSLDWSLSYDGKNHQQRITPHDVVRPHFWYVSMMNCEGVTIEGKYKIEFINVDGSQFSFDEHGMLQMTATFFTFYLLLLGISGLADYFYIRKKQFHAILQALGICIIVISFSMMFSMSHWASYKSNGIGCPACLDIGDLLDMAVEVMFTFILIVLAKGWVITTQALTGKKLMAALFGSIAAAYLALYIWSAVAVDDAENTYMYATPPGIILLILRLLTMAYFIVMLYFTLAEEVNKPKRFFYIVFGSAYSVWFLALPFVAVVALAAPYWWRYKVVQGLHYTFTYVAISGMVTLLWPHYAHKFFEVIPADLMMTATQNKLLSDTSGLL